MRVSKNKTNLACNQLLHKISSYLDTELFFYGSVQRNDYIENHSDIDICIFSNNINFTLSKLVNFVSSFNSDYQPDKNNIIKTKHFVYKIQNSDKIIRGKKIKYEDSINDVFLEISIYDDKHKDIILEDKGRKINIFTGLSLLLYIIKCLYYKYNILSEYIFDTIVAGCGMGTSTSIETTGEEITRTRDGDN